jgi:hypothetical protein
MGLTYGLRYQRPCMLLGRWGPGGLLARTRLFRRFFLCVSRGVCDVGAQLQCSLSSRKDRDGGAAAGWITLLGALMATVCFLMSCCGSPMLAVYLSLFGASPRRARTRL